MSGSGSADDLRSRKAEMRLRMRQALSSIDPVQRHAASVEACGRVVRLAEFAAAQAVMLYMPLATEIDVTSVALRCFQLGKSVSVPRSDPARRDMWPVEVTSFDDHTMEIDALGVRRPREGRPIPPESVELVIVPALAFDTSGRRLGRGGGYYDRFLVRLPRSATLVGLAFDMQLVDEVPSEGHDVRMDVVVTERRTTYTGAVRSQT